jgi:mannosyl-3-phosphoglycerate phosphatase family protein
MLPLSDILIFTDMDGTLLDHHDYSFAPVLETLKKLKQQHVPVIPNTSKTRAELMQLRDELKLDGAFIVENGAAIYLPINSLPMRPEDTELCGEFWCKSFSPPRTRWLKLLKAAEAKFSGLFQHFSAMSIKELMQSTGLSASAAKLAAQREYGEPIEWLGPSQQKQDFIDYLTSQGANPVEGGRYLHLVGDCNKGIAMKWLKNQYQQQYPERNWQTIALGDGKNDIAMLEVADVAIRILSPSNPLPVVSHSKHLITSSLYGPSGWTECIERLVFHA